MLTIMAADAIIAAVRLRRGKLLLLPLEIIARMIDIEPNMHGNTTGNVNIVKIARRARLMEVLASLSLGD